LVVKREIDSSVIPARDRAAGKVRSIKLKQLTSEIEKTNLDKPFKPLPLPKYLSKRPQFYG
jgi:hypothetical protein